MRFFHRLLVSAATASLLAGGHVQAQDTVPVTHRSPVVQSAPCCPTPNAVPTASPPAAMPQPADPGKQGAEQPGKANEPAPQPGPQLTPQALGDVFAQAPSAGTAEGGSFNPTMFGDFSSVYARRTVFTSGGSSSVLIPLANRGAFKIAENQSPRPLDRVYLNYNYYNGVSTGSPFFGNADLHYETIGFEKTLLDGNASVGLRLPFYQFEGDGSVSQRGIGDLTAIVKYALINDCQTGNVLSAGLAVTFPTGELADPGFGADLHSTLFQPYLGYIYNAGDLYVHGFSSVVLPTNDDDVTLLFNDVGIGYWLYRDCNGGFVRGIIPTLEAHLTTPTNHRGFHSTSAVVAPDLFTLTAGATILLGERTRLGIAVATPMTGPRPYDVEVLVNFNCGF